MKISYVLSVAALSLAAGSAFGQVYSGDTTGDPTYNRATAGLGSLSGVGTAVNYETVGFTVNISGVYAFQNTAVGGWDNFTFIYQNTFSPASPLVNGVIGNDDNPGIGQSGFAVALTAGTNYIYVTTGFANGDQGAYDLVVTSREPNGLVTFVPAPGAAALMGMGGLFAARRRR